MTSNLDPQPTAPPTVAPATELKPCPFCGGEAYAMDCSDEYSPHWQAGCFQANSPRHPIWCDMNVWADGIDREGVIEKWNTRAESSENAKLRARVAELEAALSKLEKGIFDLTSDSPICQLHRLKLSGLVDFIRAALKPEPASR